MSDRYRGALLGLACGDAVGTSVEFKPRGSFPRLTDMVGGGPFGLAPGQWTDDTSMALCLAVSLIEKHGFDARDQIERYCRWMDEGYLSSTGRCFDVGNTVRTALHRYKSIGHPFAGSTDPHSAGNGSLMRLAPVVLFFHPDHDLAVEHAAESSKTTHAAPECLDACRLFASMLVAALDGKSKDDVLDAGRRLTFGEAAIAGIARGEYRHKAEDAVAGTGYVVKSLEAALWCLSRTATFEDAILTAANLGDDADTTAAICGQLAGAFYGVGGIPDRWLEKLAMSEYIEQLADRLHDRRPN